MISELRIGFYCCAFRNKDGFLTMGEIKLVNKNATKNEIKVIS